MDKWLIDESVPIEETSLDASLRGCQPALAVRINDLVVHDTKKWFGSADIRLDTLILHGQKEGEPTGYYHPSPKFDMGSDLDNYLT